MTVALLGGANVSRAGEKDTNIENQPVTALEKIKTSVNPDEYPELAKFVARYACPEDLAAKVQTVETNGFHRGDTFFLKGDDIDRLINAIRAKRVIKKYKLDNIAIADKYLGLNKNGSLTVVANKIQHGESCRLSLSQVKDLTKFVEETGYRDWLSLDLINAPNNKLTFIDTEDGSFAVGMVHGNEKQGIPQNCKLIFFANLSKALAKYMEKDAIDFLNVRHEQLVNNPEGKNPFAPIFKNTEYDDADIDFEKVKTEFYKYRESKYRARKAHSRL